MLTVALPLGNSHGWGICGSNLTRELAKRSPLRLITRQFDPATVGDELEYSVLQGLHIDAEAQALLAGEIADSAMLQAATDHMLAPFAPSVRGRRNVMYTFFERTVLPSESLENSRGFDAVVGGSTWCRDVLRAHGIATAEAIFQGVDGAVFNPCENEKQFFEDQFVVFSGGKFELRKGQDLVIAALKVMQERHDDVVLVNAWFNHWPASWRTMASSRHIRFTDWQPDHCAGVNELLAVNGIDLARTVTLPAKPNAVMPRIYKNSDCGLYPNRCEGGTNLALMEYMACGKPAIVSKSSGHRDVATDRNAIMLDRMGSLDVAIEGRTVAQWDEPDLDEMIEKLEWAYRHRAELKRIGAAAGESMRAFTWGSAADQFLSLLSPG